MFCSCFVGVCGLAMSADWNIILGLVFVTALSVQLEYNDVHLFYLRLPLNRLHDQMLYRVSDERLRLQRLNKASYVQIETKQKMPSFFRSPEAM